MRGPAVSLTSEQLWERVRALLGRRVSAQREQVLATTLESLRKYLQPCRQAALSELGKGCGQRASRRWSNAVDVALQVIHRVACWWAKGRQRLCLVAVGGYGRGDMAPHSDVDLTVLQDATIRSADDEALDVVYHLVFDLFSGLHVDVGYAYRTLGDGPALEPGGRTALLDGRLVAGSAPLYRQFMRRLRAATHTIHFVLDKEHERQARRRAKGDSLYLVEPNLKDGAGGLRDLHSAAWIACTVLGIARERLLEEMAERGVISRSEARDAHRAADFLRDVRQCLHAASGRKNDVLTISHQERVAEALRYTSRPGHPAVAQLMADYWRHAAHLYGVSDRIVNFCLGCRIALDEGLISEKRQLRLDEKAGRRPLPVMRAFLLSAHYGISFDYELASLIAAEARRGQRRLQSSPKEAGDFLALLALPKRVAATLRRMQRLGVLDAFLPEIGRLMGMVPFDPAHQFTVGEHTLRMIAELESLASPQGPASPASTAMSQVQDRVVLYLASLFHDAGKVAGVERHAPAGAALARQVLARLGVSQETTEVVAWLVMEHLLMARTSRLRDLATEKTIGDFVRRVPDVQHLHMLYVLTFADTRTVAAEPHQTLEMQMLDELYAKALQVMLREVPERALGQQVEAIVENVAHHLATAGLDAEGVREHCRSMPPRYMLCWNASDIGLHLKLRQALRERPLSLNLLNPSDTRVSELTVCTYDEPEPGLLSKISGTFFAHGLNLHRVEIFTSSDRREVALDTFWVDLNGRQLEPRHHERLETDLGQVLGGRLAVEELVRTRGKADPRPLRVSRLHLDNQVSDHHTVLELVTADRAGVVYAVSHCLAQRRLDIHSVKSTIWSGEMHLAFYVTDPSGGQVPQEQHPRLVEELHQALGDAPVAQVKGGI